jgi:hypothetical protein
VAWRGRERVMVANRKARGRSGGGRRDSGDRSENEQGVGRRNSGSQANRRATSKRKVSRTFVNIE